MLSIFLIVVTKYLMRSCLSEKGLSGLLNPLILGVSLETQKPLCPQVSLVIHITSSLKNISATPRTRADTSKKEKGPKGDSTSN